MCISALRGIYQFNDFRSEQKEVIQSFAQNQDTIVIKQTGGGKSLCYTIAAILSQGINIVFSPLKALIDDQEITTRLGIDYQQASLIRNIAFENNQIIYESCENITTELQSKVSKETIAMYHSELSAKQKSAVLLD
ncbi:13721_t:CDS:2 [Funneliformis caledonium]|uniref:13721_t:CDS:1 n=1 Tax=Funneliformis caledonium TaxID=1117310 RepID=A0A9N9I3J7_9GLOM|nr:13721_t:CDS:2 [Funneliformis caledonium]